MKKIASKILIIILILLLLLNLVIIIKANTNKNKVPSIFGYKPFVVLSGSMEAEIYVGDLIVVKEINPKELQLNDIIAFRDSQNTVTTHRIVNIIKDNNTYIFETKGDNNNTKDRDLVYEQFIEGKYKYRIPELGNVVMLLQKPTTMYMMVITVLFIGFMIIYMQNNDANKELRKQNERYAKEFEKMKEYDNKK